MKKKLESGKEYNIKYTNQYYDVMKDANYMRGVTRKNTKIKELLETTLQAIEEKALKGESTLWGQYTCNIELERELKLLGFGVTNHTIESAYIISW